MNTESGFGNMVFSPGHFTWVRSPRTEIIWIFELQDNLRVLLQLDLFFVSRVASQRWTKLTVCSDVTWKCTCKEKLEYFAAPCFYFHATLPQYSIKLEVWLNVKIFYAIIDGPVASVTLWCRFRLLRWSRVLWNTMVYLELDALFACSYSNYDINFELTLAVCRTLGWKQHWNVEELRPWKASKGGVLPDGVCSTYRLKLFLQPFVGWRDAGPSSVT